LFITFEGPEGSGKTTHANLLKEYLQNNGYEVDLTREPGGTPLSENIREILLDPSHNIMNERTELLLYEAARAQHIAERIKPALETNKVVICDRFADASVVYQGIARGLGEDKVHWLNEFATEGLMPDLTFIMDIAIKDGLEKARNSSRAKWNEDTGDRIEQENLEFHRTVREGYRKLAKKHKNRCHLLDLSNSIDDVQEKIEQITVEALEKFGN